MLPIESRANHLTGWYGRARCMERQSSAVGKPQQEIGVIPDEMVASYEWVQDIGYREFLLPADVANCYSIRMCSVCQSCGSEYGGEGYWWCAMHSGR